MAYQIYNRLVWGVQLRSLPEVDPGKWKMLLEKGLLGGKCISKDFKAGFSEQGYGHCGHTASIDG